MSRPRCVVCGKAIKRATRALYLRSEEQASRGIGGSDYITLPVLPKTKEECARLTNQQVVSVAGYINDDISCVVVWDGESYVDPYLCSVKCAVRQGHASAQHGARFTWGKS